LRRGYTLGTSASPPLVYAAPKIEMLEEDNVREGFLEHEQYLTFRSELPDHQRLILVIGYHLGMRRGEILKLRWDQVDWKENLIRLEKSRQKESKLALLHYMESYGPGWKWPTQPGSTTARLSSPGGARGSLK
jgi:integrase